MIEALEGPLIALCHIEPCHLDIAGGKTWKYDLGVFQWPLTLMLVQEHRAC